jgi:phosphate transport system substrate-binding protein
MFKELVLSIAISVIPVTAMAQITGAGATFPYPIYSKWAEAFKKETGAAVNYQSIGSGAGIKQIQSKTVTFGATDMPLSDQELEKNGLVQFPLITGSVVLVHNMNQKDLVLTPGKIADIYLGNLKKLNDETVVPVRRSDGSGTTFLFTKWLSSENDDFKNKVGVGTAVSWPVGIGAKGNEGVTSSVKLSKGAIGYVEYAYAKQNSLSMVGLEINSEVITPNPETFRKNKWPMTAHTYILMYKNSPRPEATKQAIAFFTWVMKNGDKMAEELDYIPLSKEQKESNIKLFSSIK